MAWQLDCMNSIVHYNVLCIALGHMDDIIRNKYSWTGARSTFVEYHIHFRQINDCLMDILMKRINKALKFKLSDIKLIQLCCSAPGL